jgi:hypothetical protein
MPVKKQRKLDMTQEKKTEMKNDFFKIKELTQGKKNLYIQIFN